MQQKFIVGSKFREAATQLPGATQAPHFDKTSFKVHNRIFATLSADDILACIKLSPVEQSIYCLVDGTNIYPVPNAWGTKGWTFVRLSVVPAELWQEMLSAAYESVAQTKKK